MKTILILANSSIGLYNFRAELIQRLLDLKYKVFFSLPESAEDDKVKKLISMGAFHIQTFINRRGNNPLEDAKLILKYRKIIKEVGADIILTYTIKPNIYGTFAASRFKIPVIMNITGTGSSLTQGKLKSFVKRLYKFSCFRASHVFFQNNNNYRFFQDNKLVLDSTKTTVLPGSGVNLSFYCVERLESKDNSRVKFLYIGRIMREKGIEEYLEVASQVTKAHRNVEFQVLGDFEEHRYRDLLNENNAINYLGTSHDVRKEIREVDCIIHPSYHEGMSNVLLEGAAMGKPLIASDIPGCREIVNNGFNGYLFSAKSSVALLEKVEMFMQLAAEERIQMGRRSRTKVEKEFDREIVIQAYTVTIQRIIG